jgi:hypothetical protein
MVSNRFAVGSFQGLEAPDFAKPTSRLAFGVTYHNIRGAIA